MRRLGIYLTYDRQGIVDAYIGYMLKELKTCVEYLVVVCNGKNVVQGKDILENNADEIIYRENIGLDAGGFKEALTHFIGWEKMSAYDELVLVNDSLFGPFCPMKRIFDEMDDRERVDFWGLSGHSVFRKEGIDSFHAHIQSFFLTIRSHMLHSDHFRDYWEKIPYFDTYERVVREYEMQFTHHFSRLGYTYSVYADIEANNSENPANNYCQFRRIPYELIKKRNFPFLKKQQIADDKLDEQTQEELLQAIHYIDKSTDYDVNLIWKNIIRTLNITDLQRNLHLQYIIDSKQVYEGFHSNPPCRFPGTTMIIVCISHNQSSEAVAEYLDNLDMEIRVISDNGELLKDFEKHGYKCEVVAREHKINYLKSFHIYDAVCILNDVDLTSELRPSYIGKSYFFSIWNNLVKNKCHISGVLELFRTSPYLGILTSPQPNFGKYLGRLGEGWDGKFEEIYKIVNEKKINCQLSEDKPPFEKFENLWIRGSILKGLGNWKSEELQFLPYIWSYIAQDAGFYSGVVESPEYAAMNEVNMKYYLEQILELIRHNYGDFDDIVDLKKKISQVRLHEFVQNHNHVLVYGTGVLARKYKELLPNPEAYIVSDGQLKLDELDGIPVKYLSEFDNIENYGIILCLNKKNQVDVAKRLKRHGAKDILCV